MGSPRGLSRTAGVVDGLQAIRQRPETKPEQ